MKLSGTDGQSDRQSDGQMDGQVDGQVDGKDHVLSQADALTKNKAFQTHNMVITEGQKLPIFTF